MSNKKTREDFLNILSVNKPNYELIGDYVDINTKVTVRCKNCNSVYDVFPKSLIRNSISNYCKKCKASKLRKTNSEYKESFLNVQPKHIKVIGEYINSKTKIECKCDIHNYVFKSSPNNLLAGHNGCKYCEKENSSIIQTMSDDEFKNKIYKKYNNLIVLGKYMGMHTKIKLKCKDCGYEWNALPTNYIHKTRGCPLCSGNVPTTTGINDILTTNPEYRTIIPSIEYLENNTITSKNKTIFVCPICGTKKMSSIGAVHQYGLACPSCSDGISYPNKLMYNLLDSIGCVFDREYSPDWIKPKKYDFYIDKYSLIIEMDGGWHTKDNKMSSKTKEQSIAEDMFKDDMAKLNGKNVIRINCDKSDIDYIKHNILNSELSLYFNFENIDWGDIDKKSRITTISETCELYKSGNSVETISSMLKLNTNTIRRYLKTGNKYNLCEYGIKKVSA